MRGPKSSSTCMEPAYPLRAPPPAWSRLTPSELLHLHGAGFPSSRSSMRMSGGLQSEDVRVAEGWVARTDRVTRVANAA